MNAIRSLSSALTTLAVLGLTTVWLGAAQTTSFGDAAINSARSEDLDTSAPSLPIAIMPRDPNIRYLGRFDNRDTAGPRCAWSASCVELRFSGSELNVVLSDTGSDSYQVVIDGVVAAVLTTHPGTAVYNLLSDTRPEHASETHTVVLIKRTEPLVGTTQFLGFQMAVGGHMLPLPARSRRRLEVIGDSITCGYGDEAKDQNEHFTPATEDAYMSYGAVAARTLGAEYTCVAWSGRTMWPTNTLPEVYGRTLPDDATSRWDFASWTPDVVVINLGTNDFRDSNPDRQAWIAAYERFLSRVRHNYPNATLYCASGPMMSDTWPPGRQALSTINSYLTQIVTDEHRAGDSRVHFLAFAPQSAQDGYGADWHPSLKTQAIMAAVLEKTLSTDLQWTPVLERASR